MNKPTHPFFRLPTELRLCIYKHCTATTLLQLASTCTVTRSEIHSSPSIIRSSRGYWEDHPDASATLTVKDICIIDGAEEVALWVANHTQYQTVKSKHEHILRLPTGIRLIIYTYCTALTLLQLASTSSLLHAEINASPKLYTNAPGYWPYNPATDNNGLTFMNIGEVLASEMFDLMDIYETFHLIGHWRERMPSNGWFERKECGRRSLGERKGMMAPRDWCFEATGCKRRLGRRRQERLTGRLDWDLECRYFMDLYGRTFTYE
ncbi:hypothetical protein BJ508DRAFT_328331 [Ascobolus immersus RN42]|uniref:Uncharacterized protein n=1 Tax=Ascobolus immersus RN42 TaxID=1160509 RepID=A0A3N4I5I2_ASCIM|nr:hypothetical protein BJ508DRAFT_328331 [Ascobolus immersus RN42]